MIAKKPVAIVGFFPKQPLSSVTQASELAKLLAVNAYPVLTVSKYKNRWIRLIDIVCQLVLKQRKFEIVILQFYSGKSFIWQYISAKIINFFNKKLVITVHGGGVPGRIEKYPNRYLSILRSASAITVPSAYMQRVLMAYGIEAVVIENIIRLKDYEFTEKKTFSPTLLWMRAFSDIYNPLMAVRVVFELRKKYPDVKLYMGGADLGQLQQTKLLIKELGLQQAVEIVGYLDNKLKNKYAKICDIFISTNRIDNAPVTVLEMWALGLAVISTNVGGVPDLINNKTNGVLVDDDNAVDMADKITWVIEDNVFGKRLVDSGREFVHHYDEEQVYEKWDKLLSVI